jgi:hypothetical protein
LDVGDLDPDAIAEIILSENKTSAPSEWEIWELTTPTLVNVRTELLSPDKSK